MIGITQVGTRLGQSLAKGGLALAGVFGSRLHILMAIIMLSVMTGCTYLRPARPMALPEGFLAGPAVAQLRASQTRQQGYAKLFPTLHNLQIAGDLTARGSWWQGKEYFQVAFFTLTQDQDAGPQNLRLRGTRLQNSLFDVIVRDRIMTVLIHPDRQLFQGPIPEGGSPFGRRFGVEPWDLSPIFTVGQQIAQGAYMPSGEGSDGLTLVPSSKGSPMRFDHVVLDARSGLPREASWAAGGTSYEVRYLGWNEFTDQLTHEKTRLMPSAVEIRRQKPQTTIHVSIDHYQYNKEVTEKMFEPILTFPYQGYPLEALNKVFGQ